MRFSKSVAVAIFVVGVVSWQVVARINSTQLLVRNDTEKIVELFGAHEKYVLLPGQSAALTGHSGYLVHRVLVVEGQAWFTGFRLTSGADGEYLSVNGTTIPLVKDASRATRGGRTWVFRLTEDGNLKMLRMLPDGTEIVVVNAGFSNLRAKSTLPRSTFQVDSLNATP